MKIGKIRIGFIFLFSVIAYAGLTMFYFNRCNPQLKSCEYINKVLYPASFFDKGLWELTKLIRIRLISGEFITTGLISNEDTRDRFKKLNSGFNFYYKPGERPEAGFLLLSRGKPENNGLPSIELWDLNNQVLLNSYNIDMKIIRSKVGEELGAQTQFRHPILMEDGSLVISVVGGVDPLIKIDKCGNYLTHNSSLAFHHSLEIDEIGRIYSPIKLKNLKAISNDGYVILDKNLNLLRKFTLDEIFIKNNWANDLKNMKSHLNDVQPFRRNDGSFITLLSLRDHSRVIAFDQSLNKIIWIIDNAFSKQHDVDVLFNENDLISISVFDNNVYQNIRENMPFLKNKNHINNLVVLLEDLPVRSSGEIIHLSTKSSHEKYNIDFIDFQFLENDFIPRTKKQGLSDFNEANNSLMVEESNNGHIFEIDLDSRKLLWQYLNNEKGFNKITYQLNWSRRLNKLPEGIDYRFFENCK